MWTPSPEQIITAEQKQAEAEAGAWQTLRTERDARLARSDWTQVADAPVNAEHWALYRQALRDLPQNTTDPFNPEWPNEPDI